MAETDAELQLRVWKELAISKQVLMRAATDALKLNPDCTQQELKVALEAALKRSADADAEIRKAEEQAKSAVAATEKKLAETQAALTAAEAAGAAALAAQKKLEQQLADLRSSSAAEAESARERFAQKERELKDRVTLRERELKAITTALSDTPENVLKKLKDLRKQKTDESEERKRAEETANSLLKDKKKLEQTIKEMQAAQDNAVKLAAGYRELHTLCGTLREQLVPLAADAKSVPALPALDTALVEGIEKAGAAEEKKPAAKARR